MYFSFSFDRVFESYVSSKRGREIISRKISYIFVFKNIRTPAYF